MRQTDRFTEEKLARLEQRPVMGLLHCAPFEIDGVEAFITGY